MNVGIHVMNFGRAHANGTIADTLSEFARAADSAGFATFSVMDHFFQIVPAALTADPATEPMLESSTVLGFLAAQTSRIKLLSLVNGVTYRHPALLVKAVTTLDVLSKGRAIFGIGAAWYEGEHVGLGVPFPPLKERFERLEETLQIAHQMWDGVDAPFNGRWYQPQRPVNVPQSVQRPRPPIMIGGSGEKKTLRFVAQYGDACNLFDLGVAGVQAKLDILRAHCEAIGRPYDEIQKTMTGRLSVKDGNIAAAVDEAVERFAAYAAIGIETVIFGASPEWDAETFSEIAHGIAPKLAAIPVAGR